MTKSNRKSYCSIIIVFVIGIIGRGSFISLSILLIQMLVECHGFDFESIRCVKLAAYS